MNETGAAGPRIVCRHGRPSPTMSSPQCDPLVKERRRTPVPAGRRAGSRRCRRGRRRQRVRAGRTPGLPRGARQVGHASRYSETWMFSQLPRCSIDSARADSRLPASISRAGISLRRARHVAQLVSLRSEDLDGEHVVSVLGLSAKRKALPRAQAVGSRLRVVVGDSSHVHTSEQDRRLAHRSEDRNLRLSDTRLSAPGSPACAPPSRFPPTSC